jgi:hypothetical protein
MAFPFAAVAAALAPTIAGALGNNAAAGDRATSEELARLPLEFLQSLSPPDVATLKSHLAQYSSAGKLDPRLEAAVVLGDSQEGQIASDPRLVAQQKVNLEQLQTIADAGGYDPTVRADLNAALRRQEQSIKANQEALAMQAQARGMQSSGALQALQQMAAQSEANRTSDVQDRLAAAAYQNRLAALSGASAEAGRLRNSDLTEQQTRARANDLIAQFNAKTKIEQGKGNIDRLNRGEEYNLTNAQGILNKNTDILNQEEADRIAAEKAAWDAKLRKSIGLQSAASTASQSAAERAERTTGQIQGVGNAITNIISGSSKLPGSGSTGGTTNTGGGTGYLGTNTTFKSAY